MGVGLDAVCLHALHLHLASLSLAGRLQADEEPDCQHGALCKCRLRPAAHQRALNVCLIYNASIFNQCCDYRTISFSQIKRHTSKC